MYLNHCDQNEGRILDNAFVFNLFNFPKKQLSIEGVENVCIHITSNIVRNKKKRKALPQQSKHSAERTEQLMKYTAIKVCVVEVCLPNKHQ